MIKRLWSKSWFRYAFLGGTVLGIAGVIYGIILWNKPHRDIEAAEADFKLATTELANEFSNTDTTAGNKYRDKVLLVNGKVKKIKSISDTLSTLILSGTDDYEIFIEMLPKYKKEADATIPGTDVAVKALYMGFNPGDADFGLPGDINFKKGSFQK